MPNPHTFTGDPKKGWFRLEISLSLYRYFLTRQGMFEGYLLGM